MSKLILLIEDNPEMSDNIASILRLAHYEVIVASNGRIGADLAQQCHPDLILCDIMMPVLDGHGVLFILRNDPDTADIPFIFLTAKADRSDFRAGMNLGADDYITKPFDGVDLLKVVEIRLKRSESLKGPNPDHDIHTFFSRTRELRDFSKLSENRAVRSFRKAETIFTEGQMPVDLFFIEKGQLKTFKINSDGKELITGVHREGTFLGYVQLLEETAYNETAEALEDSRLIVIPKADFLALMYTSRDVARKFISMLSNNILEMENRLLDIAYQSVRQRVAGILLQLQAGLTSEDSLIKFTRRNLSSMVGTAPESFNRTLADLKDEGLIDILPDGIKIINRAKLERVLR